MIDRPEYVKCIARRKIAQSKSWCGRDIANEFHFQDVDHATENAFKGRLVACEKCVGVIVKALHIGSEE